MPANLAIALQTAAKLFTPDAAQAKPVQTEYALLAAIVAVGAVLRFWGLGAVGLHGDEETMAMPTMHLVQHGTPLLPSGMFYPRAILQLYLMAGSVMLFGESEWALRLPSALCGVLLIPIAWWTARRFLAPTWNLAFAAAVALLPVLIVDAQTARMYAFLMACVMGFAGLVFEWERTDRARWLVAAVAVLILGLQFQTLAILSAPLVFLPALLRGDVRSLWLGVIAFVVLCAAYEVINAWVDAQYIAVPEPTGALAIADGPRAGDAIPDLHVGAFVLAAALAAALVTWVVARLDTTPVRVAAGVLLGLALLAQVAYAYHPAALLLAGGAVIVHRHGGAPWPRAWIFAGVIAVLAVAHVLRLHEAGVESLRQIVGAMTGRPSVWPYLTIAEYSVAAAVVAAVGIGAALWRLAHRAPVPESILWFVVGVWVPLCLIGAFMWFIPLRYTAGQALPLVLFAFAIGQWFMRRARPVWNVAAAALLVIVVVDPVALARTAGSGYESHPDHRGAAEFLRAQTLAPNDLVLAEDVLQQTYYLGRVDYWLVAKNVAAAFARPVDGVWRDIYTNTSVVGTGEDLTKLLDRPGRGAIYVLGSGEDQQDGRRFARGFGIREVLASPRFQVVHVGRDGLTRVWKAPPP